VTKGKLVELKEAVGDASGEVGAWLRMRGALGETGVMTSAKTSS
jgi:hypothetical protein